MITEFDLQEAIAACYGAKNPSASTCLKLAAFYTVQDHLYGDKKEKPGATPDYSFDSPPVSQPVKYDSGSVFSETIKNKEIPDVLGVFDELMETLSVINPRLYNGVLAKLSL